MLRKIILITALILPSISFAAQLKIITQIVGIADANIKTNITERLNASQTNFDDLPANQATEAWFNDAPDEISQAMAPYGYFSPQINKHLKFIKDTWYATFVIKPGSPVYIRNVHISVIGAGKDNAEIVKAATAPITLQAGKILTTPAYETYKESLLEIAGERGYIKADYFYSDIHVDEHRHTANINLILNTHERYYFGPVTFHETKHAYATTFLNRFNTFKPDTPFSPKKLNEYRDKIVESTYFKEVNVVPDVTTKSKLIPINVDVTPPPPHKYTLGLGYSTWSGPRLLAGANFRQLTESGDALDTQLKISNVLSVLAAKYYIPGADPLKEQWILGANVQRFLPQNGSSSSSSVSGAYNYKQDKWQTNLSLNYLLEQYKTDDTPTETSTLLYPSLNVNYVDTDNVLNPSWGRSLNVTLRGAEKGLLSSTRFMQGEVAGKYITSIRDGTRMIGRADVGYSVVHEITDLPLSMRFFTGGANSVRGYKDSSIGPGKYLLVGSLELQQRIYGNWNAALFGDEGKATDHFNEPWSQSVGVGVLYTSIIGPIKVYVARDISLPSRPNRIEFSFGPEF